MRLHEALSASFSSLLLAAGALACAARTPGANAHDMSAGQHAAMAESEGKTAELHGAQYDPKAQGELERCYAPRAHGAAGCWDVHGEPNARASRRGEETRKDGRRPQGGVASTPRRGGSLVRRDFGRRPRHESVRAPRGYRERRSAHGRQRRRARADAEDGRRRGHVPRRARHDSSMAAARGRLSPRGQRSDGLWHARHGVLPALREGRALRW